MDALTLKNLEFARILEDAASYAQTASGREAILASPFYDSLRPLNEELDYVEEAGRMSLAMGRVPLYGYIEVADLASHASKGGVLRCAGLLRIASALRCASQLAAYLTHGQNPSASFPLMESYAGELWPQPALEKELSAKILSEEDLADDASPELYSIRRQMRRASSQIKDRLSSLTTSQETRKYLQDGIVTMRQGRYVVPVKAEHKNAFDGIIHDSSSSGLTLFIEPAAVVALNNQLRELEAAEAREIEAILADLSSKVRASSEAIIQNEGVIATLDRFFAKAAYGFASRHTRPMMAQGYAVHLRGAFHPLIGAEKCVPSDIDLGEGTSYHQIVITGPNTGGKTVLIKTLGLCALMASAGFFIPAAEGSHICLFDDVYADIGDEQSIEQSLSTFSSHMKRIIAVLDKATTASLVLLDEIGAGTDPSEGAALARAVLESFRLRGNLLVATTHYNEIKRYGLLSPGVINASMEFDVEKLAPTFHFHIGVPGKSNAFEISEGLGLGSEVLELASSYMQTGAQEFEDVIGQLEEKLSAAREAYEEAEKQAQAASELREKIASDLAAFRSVRDKEFTKAALEAKGLVTSARATAKEIISEAERFRENTQASSRGARDRVAGLANDAINEANTYIPTSERELPDAEGLESVMRGMAVSIPELNATGTVLEAYPDAALVQVGVIKTKLPLTKLARAADEQEKGAMRFSNLKSQSVSSKLDIRGITGPEAEIEVDKYIDDAALANLKTVTIVHGKGSGALRKAVQAVLDRNPSVEGYRIGGLNEGGEGATIVTLR